MQIDRESTVNASTLAVVLGVTARRIQQLAQDGIFTAVKRGQYSVSASVQSYIAFLVREKEESAGEKEKNDVDIRIKRAKADMLDLELQELQGKMHRSEDVATFTEDLIYAVRGALMALPGRMAIDVSQVKSASEASEIIRIEACKVLEELSQYKYDPAKYEERVRERMNWDELNADNGS